MTEKALATTEPGATAVQAPMTREERRYLSPPVDIYEVENGLEVLADMPGVPADGIEVKVDAGVLTIVGHARAQEEAEYEEFRLNDYYRQFRLGELVDSTRITAELRHGLLRISLPKPEQSRPRMIEVKVN